MIYFLLSLSCFFTHHKHSFSEPSDRWLIELTSAGSTCLDNWWLEQGMDKRGYLKKVFGNEQWMVIEVPGRFSSSIEKLSCVRRMLEDKPIKWRNTEPNDPAFISQNDMKLIGMTKAWDITTGGVTSRGDTIVVAVMDSGFQQDHEDLGGNLWFNRHETPNDEIDNDGNGYVDDYRGLNVSTGSDQHPEASHGTSVLGIIGAKGNNNRGVAGVNWNVKMMMISEADFESELIECYEYVLDMRKRYRLSNGEEGAFVVATNLSGGIDYEFAIDHPLWCEMYDKLGEEGILSVCAAPNNPISVDVEGDMPTTCTSPFMIAVTNVDVTDILVGNAGFGPINIDLGAPGHGTITIAYKNQYAEFTGTSSATPHVTGTIALMYSTPCISFLENVDSDPQGVAGRVRDIIFSTGKDNNTLQDITATGKRLQADAALNATITDCDSTTYTSLRIVRVQPNPPISNFVDIYFEFTGDTSTAYFDLYTVTGVRVKTYPISQAEFEQRFLHIDTRPLAAGIYMVTLRSKKEKATAKLFVY